MAFAFMLIIMLTFCAFSFERTAKGVRAARLRTESTLERYSQQLERLRRSARESLGLSREVRQLRKTMDVLREQINQMQQDVYRLAQPANRIFVLDERRGPDDAAWLVIIEAAPDWPPEKLSWSGRRRFRVWAADATTAKAKAAKRYHQESGYAIAEATPL
jgi:hypothetical protein